MLMVTTVKSMVTLEASHTSMYSRKVVLLDLLMSSIVPLPFLTFSEKLSCRNVNPEVKRSVDKAGSWLWL